MARKPLAAAAGSQLVGTLAPNALATIDEDIGDAHWLAGDRAAAERAYGAALALRERLVSASPTNGEFAASVVYSVTRFASRLIESGRTAEARAHTQRVRALLEQQADAPGAVGSRFTELAFVAQPADRRDPAAALRHRATRRGPAARPASRRAGGPRRWRSS